jgi:ABC-2 type transport system ATP-binding protein
VIAVQDLAKEFGRTRAVCGVTFRVERGEVIGLLGPNGSGKTTIMRILTGFFPPTSGCAEVAGIDVTRAPLAARERVGYLPENAVLYPDLRVRQLLEFCADVHRLRGAHKRARLAAVIEDCGLGEVRERLIGKLSKGYRQRVGLAQALLCEPEVLILDEPTVGLDPRQIIEIRSLIGALRGRTTVLLSTHILPEAATVCQRVIIIDRGRIVAEDTAAELTSKLEGAERTFVRVDGPPEAVLGALRAVPGVERVEAENGTPAAGAAFVAYTGSGDAARRAIAAAVVRAGWGLLEVRPLALTLEDLFVRLVTREEQGGPAA